MNKNLTVTVSLTPADIKTAIAEFVSRNLEDHPTILRNQVTIDISTTTVGYGIQEHDVTECTGATVKIETNPQLPISDPRD